MPLETTLLWLDLSGFMRNGDYAPSRLACELDAAIATIEAKRGSHPESTVGIVCVTETSTRVLVSATADEPKLLASLHGLTASGGAPDFVVALKTSKLALKHRKTKTGGQRIIIFTGSPINAKPEELKKLGEQLRKDNVRRRRTRPPSTSRMHASPPTPPTPPPPTHTYTPSSPLLSDCG